MQDHISGHHIPKSGLRLADLNFLHGVSDAKFLAKATAARHRDLPGEKQTAIPCALISIDTKGPIEVASYGGNRFVFVAVDIATSKSTIAVAANKSAVTNFVSDYYHKAVKPRLAKMEQLELPVTLLSDNAKELKGVAMKEVWRSAGVAPIFTSAYSFASNGIAERRIGVLEPMTNALRIHAGLPVAAWAECWQAANFLPTRAILNNWSSYQMEHKDAPFDVCRLGGPIGSTCFLRIPPVHRQSIGERLIKGVLKSHAKPNPDRLLCH